MRVPPDSHFIGKRALGAHLIQSQKNNSVEQHISQFYNFESQEQIFKDSIDPVVVNVLKKDGKIKPTNPSSKRQAGRLQKNWLPKPLKVLTHQMSRQSIVVIVKKVVIMLRLVIQDGIISQQIPLNR